MANVLFYSQHDNNSKELLHYLNSTGLGNQLNYICIDNRRQHQNGIWYATLSSGTLFPLPQQLKDVPTLMTSDYRFLVGHAIKEAFMQKAQIQAAHATQNAMEPQAIDGFGFGGLGGGCGVTSDSFSMWDSQQPLVPQNQQQQQAYLEYERLNNQRQMHGYVNPDDTGRYMTGLPVSQSEMYSSINPTAAAGAGNVPVKRGGDDPTPESVAQYKKYMESRDSATEGFRQFQQHHDPAYRVQPAMSK